MKLSRTDFLKILAVISFLIWFTLLTLGITINSSPYLNDLAQGCGSAADFLMVMVAFTPTNVALLAVWAGLAGGLTSNLAAENYFQHVDEGTIDATSPDFQRLIYMTESPIVSALRGFMVYMIFIVGASLSLTSANNNDQVTTIFNVAKATKAGEMAPALYYRFSLTVSLLAFLVGFDPTRLGSWINAIPTPGPKPGGELPKP
jgi:hypothetical protein